MLFWDKNYFELKILEKQIPLGTCCFTGRPLCTRNNPKLPGPGLFQDELVTYLSRMGYEWFPGVARSYLLNHDRALGEGCSHPTSLGNGSPHRWGRVIPHSYRKWGLSPWAKADPKTCLDF